MLKVRKNQLPMADNLCISDVLKNGPNRYLSKRQAGVCWKYDDQVKSRREKWFHRHLRQLEHEHINRRLMKTDVDDLYPLDLSTCL